MGIWKRSRSLKIHPLKYRDPFTNHLVENLAARLLFYFGQCAKLSGIHFPNSEESQTCLIGKRIILRRRSGANQIAPLERPSQTEFLQLVPSRSKWFSKTSFSDESRAVSIDKFFLHHDKENCPLHPEIPSSLSSIELCFIWRREHHRFSFPRFTLFYFFAWLDRQQFGRVTIPADISTGRR